MSDTKKKKGDYYTIPLTELQGFLDGAELSASLLRQMIAAMENGGFKECNCQNYSIGKRGLADYNKFLSSVLQATLANLGQIQLAKTSIEKGKMEVEPTKTLVSRAKDSTKARKKGSE